MRPVPPRHPPLIVAALALAACSGAASTTAPDAPGATPTPALTPAPGATLPALYAHFRPSVSVAREAGEVVLRSDDIPDHPSPYFGPGHPLYVAPHAGMQMNPNRILAQSLEFRVPAEPAIAAAARETPLGPIGIAKNGVALFNPYAAGYSSLDPEKPSFDLANGHPQQMGQYHYHLDPVALSAADPAALIGVLLDGFPVYGPRELGGGPPLGLDVCNGHVGVTPDSATATYHYHITAGFPYISGCFTGSPGTVSN